MQKQTIHILLFLLTAISSKAQTATKYLTLAEAIQIAQTNSPTAQMAELSFMSQYWSFRSYKAELLPSVSVYGNLGNYNRSMVEARDAETGEINYVSNNTLSNDVSLSLNQQIALTGGSISINSNLSRLDQFDYNNKYYNSTPININYSQPLRAFNALKWQKKTAPLQYENAKRQFLETMENITIQTTSLFFGVLAAQTTLRNSITNNDDTKRMYSIAQKRFDIGTSTKSELLQLELSLLNSDLEISNKRIELEIAIFNLRSYLGMPTNDFKELLPPNTIPEITLNYDFVLERALNNSTHQTTQELNRLDAEKAVAQAKANRGLQLDLNANLGMSQTANSLPLVYQDLRDREVVGLTVSMPIFDWGMSRGQVKMSEAQKEVILTEIQQSEIEFRQDITIKVLKFNNLTQQCAISKKALEISKERYDIMVNRFQNGGVTVTDLNTAQTEMDNANNSYVNQLRTFWEAYYELQKLSLYDYINEKDINTEFDKIVESQSE